MKQNSVHDFFKIDPILNGLIIGKSGSNIKALQAKSNTIIKLTEIDIAGRQMVQGALIKGKSEVEVEKAKEILTNLIIKGDISATRVNDENESPVVLNIKRRK